tara:strand:- start:3943 stop:4323 length:381 start_codon:yes stop_codon:yes gene_type:complete
MAENQSIIGKDVLFKGKITNSKTIEVHGRVEADIKSEKITLGKTASYEGGIQADLVVISGKYQGKLKADSVWLTDSSIISGEINYKSLQMDRGAALNCRVIHNWDEKKLKKRAEDNLDNPKIDDEN